MDMVEPYYMKGVRKQLFADVLKYRCKIYRKTTMLESLFNKVAHVLSYDLYGIFKSTYFLITPQNQMTLLRKKFSKVT